MPGVYNHTIWIGGNSDPLHFSPVDTGETFDHTGSTWLLVVRDAARAIVLQKTGTIGTVAGIAGVVTFAFTVADSRLVPPGPVLTYEIEQRIGGTEKIWLEGKIVGKGGVNTDA